MFEWLINKWRDRHPEIATAWAADVMRLEMRRTALVDDLTREPEPGEIREPYAQRVKAGPVPVINLKRSAT